MCDKRNHVDANQETSELRQAINNAQELLNSDNNAREQRINYEEFYIRSGYAPDYLLITPFPITGTCVIVRRDQEPFYRYGFDSQLPVHVMAGIMWQQRKERRNINE